MKERKVLRTMILGSISVFSVVLVVGFVLSGIYSAKHALIAVMVLMMFAFAGVIIFYMRERRVLDSEIMQSVAVDDLTGLPTKQQHKIEATKILNETRGKYAYVSVDIADFKFFNENYGYAYGNVALKQITAVWSAGLKKNELLSRTTGDRFCMLLRYNNQNDFSQRIYQMMEAASEFPIDEKGNGHQAMFRCGIYPIRGGEDINMIRSRADMARKRLGKCCETTLAYYSESDIARELEKKELETEVRRAVEEKELMVYFQPKFDIMSEKVIGAEALIRWNHPEKGMLSPGTFIPLCEENGYICTVDFYVLDEVCRKMRQWKDSGCKLIKVSVNFSRLHLSNADFVDKLVNTVKHYELDPSNLEIELTETVAYDEMETLLDTMRRIKAAGFGLSMDDFGSGYSSLNLLREMPVDVLKLDKGFLDDCGGNSTRERSIISHVISMAKDLHISVLAEGVETVQQKDFLKESHCDMIQGYYYAKPMPTENFINYLEVSA